MHHLHQADANHGHENESTPFLASAASAQQQQQPASSRSPSRSPRLDYRSVNRSYSPLKQIDSHCNNDNSSNNNRNKGKSKKNTKSPFDSDSDSDQDGDHPGGLASSASSISSLLPDDQENSPISPSTSPLTQRRRGHRLHYLQMLLAIAAQLGLLIFFGTLAGVTAKAPWVYPYSWHPICMGLYGFVATEGILLLQPIEKASQKRAARTVHGILQILALIFSLIGFVAIYRNKDLKKKVHFHTNHALLGCAAVAVFFLQVLFGVLVAYAPRRMFSCIGYARVLRIHRVAGYVSIVLMWGTFWLSVLTNWMKTNFANHEWVFALGMGMIAVGIVGQVTPSRLWLSRSSNNSSNNNSNNKRSLVQSNADNSFSP